MTRSLISDSRRPVLPVTSYAKPYELELSLFMVVVLSGVYIAYEILAEPRGGHPFGHSLGVIGTLLMVMTELLYSVRKRTGLLNWAGPVRYWLSFHIFTGIVGPFLVLMHTGLQFRGLAGVSMLLTMLVVTSGFVGRYLYTALPRTLTGVTASRQEIEAEIQDIHVALYQFEIQKPELADHLVAHISQRAGQRNSLLTVFGHSFFQWRYRHQLKRALRELEQLEKSQRKQLEELLARKRELERQTDMLEAARRLLRSWHILHIPIGLTLFFSVEIHVAAVLYFRAGLFR
jgi:cell division protein FtsB